MTTEHPREPRSLDPFDPHESVESSGGPESQASAEHYTPAELLAIALGTSSRLGTTDPTVS